MAQVRPRMRSPCWATAMSTAPIDSNSSMIPMTMASTPASLLFKGCFVSVGTALLHRLGINRLAFRAGPPGDLARLRKLALQLRPIRQPVAPGEARGSERDQMQLAFAVAHGVDTDLRVGRQDLGRALQLLSRILFVDAGEARLGERVRRLAAARAAIEIADRRVAHPQGPGWLFSTHALSRPSPSAGPTPGASLPHPGRDPRPPIRRSAPPLPAPPLPAASAS